MNIVRKRDIIIEGRYRIQNFDNMDRWKAEMGRVRRESQRREEKRKKEIKEEKVRESQKKEDAGARKGGKVAKHFVFPMIYGSEGWKVGSLKRAGAEPAGQIRNEKLHPLWRSTFPDQHLQSTSASDHFWKLRCRKSVRVVALALRDLEVIFLCTVGSWHVP